MIEECLADTGAPASEKLIELVTLHSNLTLTTAVAELLNSEWPRSMTARLHSLKSSDSLPCSLVLVNTSDKGVIGHSKISQVLGRPNDLIIESVVIRKDLRGHGYGRMLMEFTEHYSKGLGYTTTHLSTHDKCKFYERLGYIYSSPVNPVRLISKFLINTKFSQMETESLKIVPNREKCPQVKRTDHNENKNRNNCRSVPPVGAPPPPPPPPPAPPAPPPPPSSSAVNKIIFIQEEERTGTMWMSKALL